MNDEESYEQDDGVSYIPVCPLCGAEKTEDDEWPVLCASCMTKLVDDLGFTVLVVGVCSDCYYWNKTNASEGFCDCSKGEETMLYGGPPGALTSSMFGCPMWKPNAALIRQIGIGKGGLHE